MAKKKKKQNISTSQKVGFGVGLTAAAVAAAGTYFLYGSPNAAKNRKKVKSWTLKAKAEVLEALEDAQDITEEEYRALVEAVAGAYGSFQKVSKSELNEFKKEMMDHWRKIEKTAPVRKVSRSAKKAAKKAAKRVTGKSSKKRSKSSRSKSAKKGSKRSAKKTTKKSTKKSAKKSTKKRTKK